MAESAEQEIRSKFNLLSSKLEELNIKISEAVNSIKNNLIPVFEKSLADMQLSIDRLMDKNSQMQTRFEQQTEFLLKNLTESATNIKTIFDINKLEDILQKTGRITEVLNEELQNVDLSTTFKELKTTLSKLK
ncbi:MAG: hypothetical protein OdinLCB4_006275 [Candidatus Odinarchaeum yellowstonii]|uniref:Uncharacterized protein n=1 Tax=Odinarchaeota yellowstonii (strain LCB_4) TaxID=1841599 RepID=A0AAF0IAK3_ODILC|nr:MAG: hypothetical protein OdinLCB4_006275 [Candidatus Odinarchaeum yellowstonii]